jgi:hypothetical protein
MSFKISYAVDSDSAFKSLTLKEKIFSSDWDASRIEDEIKEYVYTDIENRGLDLDEDAIVYKDIEKVAEKIAEHFQNANHY